MPSSYIERSLVNFLYDALVDQYVSGVFWNTVLGAPTFTTPDLVLAPGDEVGSLANLTGHINVEFNLKVKTDPASGDAKIWGLRDPSLGNRGAAYFEISGTVFRVRWYDEDGTTLLIDKTVTWDSANWKDAYVKYRIQIGEAGAKFFINDSVAASVDNLFTTPFLPLRIDVKNTTGGAGNLNLASVMIRQAELVQGASSAGGGSTGTVNTSEADASSNTKSSLAVSSRMQGYNGSTWDRVRAGITAIGSTFTGFLNSLPWAIYHATPTSRTDGQGGPLEADASGNLQTNLATKVSGEDTTNDVMKVEEQNNYVNITTATTTTVKSGAGMLHAITVNATAAGTITIYDNTAGSGTKIGTLKASIGEQTFIFDAKFSTGLTIVTGAASDITVSYR